MMSLMQIQRLVRLKAIWQDVAECRKEFEDAKKIWDLMGELPQPEPSASMKTGFDAILCKL